LDKKLNYIRVKLGDSYSKNYGILELEVRDILVDGQSKCVSIGNPGLTFYIEEDDSYFISLTDAIEVIKLKENYSPKKVTDYEELANLLKGSNFQQSIDELSNQLLNVLKKVAE
jgi:hypothetical protein